MDLASTYDANQKDLNLGEILHGESLVKGAQNLHSVTLYVYPTHFLVRISSKNFQFTIICHSLIPAKEPKFKRD